MKLTAMGLGTLAADQLLAQPPQKKDEDLMDVRTYLCREARRISNECLAGLDTAEAHRTRLPEMREQYMAMMGLHHLPWQQTRTPPEVTITGTVEREGYRIEKLYYAALPQLYITANLYVPTNLSGPAPAVIYVCGHGRHQKWHYQAHPRRFAQLGFLCLIVETVQLGEVTGYHHGCYREGWWHWYSRGYTPAGLELWTGMRGLDLLQARPEVDGNKLGVTGISGGGATSWWLAAGDERIKVAAPCCGTAALASHIIDRTIDGHCDCMWWINSRQWDLPTVGALIAPRPLLIASADRDAIFTIDSIREVHSRLAKLYETLGAKENLALVETPGPHSYHERSRTAIFSWFVKHLMGKDISPTEIGDISEEKESEDTLRVYIAGPPAGNRVPTIHDEFIPLAGAPQIEKASDLRRVRTEVISALREHTFGHFPRQPCDLETRVEFQFESGDTRGYRFSYVPEDGWRLTGKLLARECAEGNARTALLLRSPREDRNTAEALAAQLGEWPVKVILEPRGTGETGYEEELQWHLRRSAAWCGMTLASMRVYDVLRGLEAIRTMKEVAIREITIVARGEMCTVALYAALLDGHVAGLQLIDPPASQNEPSQPDGKGPAIEMLNCLRFTDLPYVAGMLWPAVLRISGQYPKTYDWASAIYRRLGEPGRFEVTASLE
ncbi:MAG: alpha/beta hydrolase family protein [Candidatus Zipacnadales bacterium]